MLGERRPECGSVSHSILAAADFAQAAQPKARTGRPSRLEIFGLAAVLIVTAALRLPALASLPPGLNQDEAANAWNAWCLLKTGQDQVGQSWPIFCIRALGEYRSALFLYVVMPFQAVWGLNIWTTRLPSAIGGVATVLLAWWVGRRMCGPGVGVVTAALLAVNPTHLQMSRLGHEGSITPLLTLAPLGLLIWAGFVGPGFGRETGSTNTSVSPLRALVAGLVIGICCYGYPAARLFIPAFVAVCVLATPGGWLRLARSRRGLLAIAALCLGIAITFGPLVWQHLAHPEMINQRGEVTWVWRADDPVPLRAAKVLERYVRHFGPDFLYINGDALATVWTTGTGYIPWPLLPLQIGGLVLVVRRWRHSAAARVLVVGLLLFPLGDCFNSHVGDSLSGLRSSPGLVPLSMLAACGLVWLAGSGIHARQQAAVIAVAAALALHFVKFAQNYTARGRELYVYSATHGDLLAAHQFLTEHIKPGDKLVISDSGMNQPYVVWLVADQYDPRRWFAEPREMQPGGDWDRYTRFGDTYFLNESERAALVQSLEGGGRPDHVFFAVRPGETAPGTQIGQVPGPDGRPALVVYEAWL